VGTKQPHEDVEAGPLAARSPRSGKILLLLGVLVCLVGLGIAGELTSIHVWVHTDPDYRSFCAVSETVNCDTVAESPYSVFLGVPVAVWGLLGYLLLGAVFVSGLRGRRPGTWPAGLLLVLSSFALLASLVLGTISAVAIHSFCILCVATYLLNAVLFGLAVLLACRRGGAGAAVAGDWRLVRARLVLSLVIVGGIGAIVLALLLFYPNYWNVRTTMGPGGIATGVTPEGDSWIGARQPRLTVIEYSDYQCPHCERGHKELRARVAANPEQVRFIHRHFPLDDSCNPLVRRPFHPRACALARWVVCAGRQGKAWEANDLIFAERGQAGLTRDGLASRLGLDHAQFVRCLDDPTSLAAIRRDIDAGLELGVRGTPSYAVGSTLYPGHISPEQWEQLLGVAASPGAPATAAPAPSPAGAP